MPLGFGTFLRNRADQTMHWFPSPFIKYRCLVVVPNSYLFDDQIKQQETGYNTVPISHWKLQTFFITSSTHALTCMDFIIPHAPIHACCSCPPHCQPQTQAARVCLSAHTSSFSLFLLFAIIPRGLSGPHDAGHYNCSSWETGFFVSQGGSWNTTYGHFFLEWYSGALARHVDRVLGSAASAMYQHGRPRVFKAHKEVRSVEAVFSMKLLPWFEQISGALGLQAVAVCTIYVGEKLACRNLFQESLILLVCVPLAVYCNATQRNLDE